MDCWTDKANYQFCEGYHLWMLAGGEQCGDGKRNAGSGGCWGPIRLVWRSLVVSVSFWVVGLTTGLMKSTLFEEKSVNETNGDL